MQRITLEDYTAADKTLILQQNKFDVKTIICRSNTDDSFYYIEHDGNYFTVTSNVVPNFYKAYCLNRELKELENNERLFKERSESYSKLTGVKVGDYVLFSDGNYELVSHVYSDGELQTSFCGSFYVFESGVCEFSGGLNRAILESSLSLTDEMKENTCWIFDQDISGAGRAVYFSMPRRVWKSTETSNTK